MGAVAGNLASVLDWQDFGDGWDPKMDVYRGAGRWVIKLELAGVLPEDVHIVEDGNSFEVKGFRKDSLSHAGFSPEQMEIAYSGFTKRIDLPISLRQVQKEVTFQDGMLYIWLTTKV